MADSKLPTKPGPYWWRQNTADRWQLVRLILCGNDNCDLHLTVKTEDGHLSPLDNRWDGRWSGPLREPG